MTDELKIKGLLEQASEALRVGDWSKYQGFWAHEPLIELIHPAQNEWLVGWAAIEHKYHSMIASGITISAERISLNIRVSHSREIAWATGESIIQIGSDSIHLWQTFIFKNQNEQWHLVHGHVSVPST